MISLEALTVLVYVAIVLVTATPVILCAMVIHDWKNGNLW